MSKLWMLSLISCAAFALPACTAELTSEDQELLEDETLAAEVAVPAYIYGFNNTNGSWVRRYTNLRNTSSYVTRTSTFGMAGDIPLLVPSEYAQQPPRIAVLRPSTGRLFIDYNDNGWWDNATLDREIATNYDAGDKPFIVMGRRWRRNLGVCQQHFETDIQYGVKSGGLTLIDRQGLYAGTQFGATHCASNLWIGYSTDAPAVSHRFRYVGVTRPEAPHQRWTFDSNQDGELKAGDWDSYFGNSGDIVGSGPGPASQRGTTVFWDRNFNMWWDPAADATFTGAMPNGYRLVGVGQLR